MAVKKKTTKSKSSVKKRTASKIQQTDTPVDTHIIKKHSDNRFRALSLILLVFVGFFIVKKDIFLAAVVNGKPIFTWDLNNILQSRFGEQTLEAMVSEELVTQAARKAGISVTQDEINQKINEITQGLGENVDIDQLLTLQGLTREEFEKQLTLQMSVEKLLRGDISITEEEVDAFIASNSAFLTATTGADMREEAKQLLFDQKISEKIREWFEELQSSANVKKYL